MAWNQQQQPDGTPEGPPTEKEPELYYYRYPTYNSDDYPKEKAGWRIEIRRYSTAFPLSRLREYRVSIIVESSFNKLEMPIEFD